MAIICLRVPHEVTRLLDTIDVPGSRVLGSEKHVTVLHLGDDVPIDTLSSAVAAIYNVTSNWKPFSAMLDRIESFPKNEDGVPIIMPVTSPELLELHAALSKSLDEVGVSYSKKFPEYKPHVTLSYAEKAKGLGTIEPLEWGVFDVILWGGEQGDGRLSAVFPFSLPGKTALYRQLVRLRSRHVSAQ
jgi:2'-5' RNA ligase